MCYAVDPGSIFFNKPVTKALERDPELAARYGALFAEAGITTTHQLDKLLTAVRQGTAPAMTRIDDAVSVIDVADMLSGSV